MVTRAKARIFKPLECMNYLATTTSPLPRSHVHALFGPNWKQTMLDEYNALITNVDQQGIDCDETFSLAVKPVTICTALSLARIIALLHSKFAREILERAHLEKCNSCKTFVDTDSKLSYGGEPRILRYVRGTIDYGLQLHVSSTAQLTAYIDADWAGCPVTRRSTSGYCVFLGENLLSLSAKRQVTLSRSSDVAWIRNLLCELHTPLFIATLVYCDNMSAIYISANPVHHQRTKHIEIDIHFVRDFVASGHVRVLYVPSRFQYADIFTKNLPSALFLEFRSSLNDRRPSILTAGRDQVTGQECPYPCYPPPTGGGTSGGGGGNPPPTTTTTFSPPSQIGYYPPPSSIFPYNPPNPNYYGNGQPAPDPVVPWLPYYYKKPPHKTDDSSSSGVPIVSSSRIFLIHVLVFSFMLLAH
uniref:Ribonuclease H-like domain-containing protein n=1 Tax=Tanacetum cinerariifolium TaxID=118510 RepID=A0A6L2L686_TANCI|nr:ribonuclease H-like domain-containing protein [Tanacetum cinerariifolium]